MTTKNVVFIDSRVADLQKLVAGLGADTEWVLLDAEQNGVLQMQTTLADKRDLDSMRIIAHGRPGAVQLGSAELTQETIDDHASALGAIGKSLGEQGDVQIYACELGLGAVGRAFVRKFSERVGAYVSASSVSIGHASLGGQWILDVGHLAVTQLDIPEWQSVLGLSSTPQTISYSGKSGGEFRNAAAFAALRADGSVVTWGDSTFGGNSSAVATQLDGTIAVTQIFSGYGTFAALRIDGSVVTWGYSDYGGDKSSVAAKLDGTVDVTQVYSSQGAFAALRADGSVVTWGAAAFGGNSSVVATKLDGTIDVKQVFSSYTAFAALRIDGSVVTWGDSVYGGNSSLVATKLDGTLDVTKVFATEQAFAALRVDGSVVAWGDSIYGGDSSLVAPKLDGTLDVTQIFSTRGAFAALRTDGSVVTWGASSYGGDISAEASKLDGTIDVTQICSTGATFAALRTDGSVVTWGYPSYGGNSTSVSTKLDGTVDVIQICATGQAFAALRSDGSVVTWGQPSYGGDSGLVASKIDGTVDVTQLFATKGAFAALRADGSLVVWGASSYGGDSSAFAAELDGTTDVIQVYSCDDSFAALRADGLVVTWPRSPGDVSSQLTNVVSMANPFTNDVYRAVSVVNGTPGNDPALLGGGSDEELYGFAGNDTLDGGQGNDTMYGGQGNDTYYVRQAGDSVVELLNEGTDIAYSYLSAYTLTANVENGRITHTGTANLTGNSLNNTLYAGLGNNVITGGGGVDTVSYAYGVSATGTTGVTVSLATGGAQATVGSGSDTLSGIVNLTGSNNNDTLTGSALANVLNGGAGVDIMDGGLGNDTYYLDRSTDVVVESNATAVVGGVDTVVLGGTITNYTLGNNVENGRIQSIGAVNLTGNLLNNVLYAGIGDNIISGGGGTDTLSYLYGVTGTTGVTVSLALGGAQTTVGSGLDTINAIRNLTGSAYADNLTGNVLANVLDGGTGADTLAGGDGSDTYYVRDVGDVVVETNAVSVSGGTDLVYSYLASYTLTSNVENAQIVNSGSAKLIGNTGNNRLTGANANDTLEGGLGNDTLNGGAGQDSLYGGAGDDLFFYDATNDALDRFDGGAGFDVVKIAGSMGAFNMNDLLKGGLANRSSIEALQFSDGIYRLETDYSTNYKVNPINYSSFPYLSGLSTKYQIDHPGGGTPLVFNYYFSDSGWTAAEKASIKTAFQTLQNYINIDFLEGTLVSADLILNKVGNDFFASNGVAEPSKMLGAAFLPGYANEQGDSSLLNGERTSFFNSENANWSPAGLTPGAFGFQTIIHEFGHALGLAHPNNDNAGSTIFPGVTSSEGDLGDNDMNQGIWTMMSYNEGWASKFNTLLSGWGDGREYGYEATPMALDIKVLQDKYGARVETPDANGSYDDTFLLPLSDVAGVANFKCIYDTQGVNKISALGSTRDVVIDLRPAELKGAHAGGYVSYAEGIHGGFTIADGSKIEQALGGVKNDHLIGNAENNFLDGRTGTDTMEGGIGNDTYVVYESSDIVMENANEGIDLIQSWITYSLYDTDGLLSAKGGNVENLRLMGAAAFNIDGTGNALNNVIEASAGNNVIDGAAGVDTVSYAFGVSSTAGVAVSLNTTSAQVTGGSGSDKLISIENIIGSSYADTLIGNSLSNILAGGAGNDALDGGTGIDTLTGGDGSDVYYVRDVGDIVTETNALASTGGTDLVYSYISSYTLTANVENGRIVTTAAANLTGNNLSNVIYAGAGNNILSGGAGTEIDTVSYAYGLSGTTGVTVDLSATAAQATVGSGNDTLSKIENVIGSAYADKLTGSSGTNVLTGGAGADILKGNGGNDIFDFNTLAEMGTSFVTWDVISDFNFGDKIDLSTLDANTATTTNDAFSGTLVTAFTAAGQLKLSAGVLYGNTDANYATNEFAIQLTGVNTLTAADFVL